MFPNKIPRYCREIITMEEKKVRLTALALEHRFSNQFFILQDETFNPKTRVSALTFYPNIKKF